MRLANLPFNKVCEYEDFEHPVLQTVLREVFEFEEAQGSAAGAGRVPDSKHWATAMSLRALGAAEALHRTARVLAVGAGTDPAIFHLTRHVREVVAADLYLHGGARAEVAPPAMLVDPSIFAPFAFERERLVVQHMDGRWLEYPADTFDAVVSAGSIEHLGGLDQVANCAYEMGRVLKPGGLLTLSTVFKIAGPPGGNGWDAQTLILSPELIQRYLVEASGLDPLDSLQPRPSDATMRCRRDLSAFLGYRTDRLDWNTKVAHYPNLILVHEGYVFCAVHLALRKTDNYPEKENAWAKPSRSTEEAVARSRRRAVAALREQVGQGTKKEPEEVAPAVTLPPDSLSAALALWESVYHRTSSEGARWPRLLRGFYRILLRVRHLGRAWEAQAALNRGLLEKHVAYREHVSRRLEALERHDAA